MSCCQVTPIFYPNSASAKGIPASAEATFSVPVSFPEANFEHVAKCTGSCNASLVVVNETAYSECTIQFLTARCGLDDKTMKYDGYADFKILRHGEVAPSINFTQLLQLLEVLK
jgi:hypothetical protein